MSTPASSTLAGVDGVSDGELIAAVRDGDTEAYGVLFERHVEAARRLARQLVSGPDVDDLVSEAFAKVLALLQRGGGPDLAFRAYLLTAVRRLHVDRLRAAARLQPVADLAPFDPGVPFQDTAVEGFENATAARAFASLPERWQLVLWHTEVEGQRPAEVAPLLGLSPNSVSALAYRAREGLRQAYLSQHAQDPADASCAWTQEHLGAYVRGGLARRDAARVEEHVGGCHRCAAVWLELDDLNAGLAGVLAPLLLGGAVAAGYVGSGAGGLAGGLTSGLASGLAGGVAGFAGRLRDLAAAHAPAATAAGLALGASVVSGVLLWPGHDLAPAPTPPSSVAAPPVDGLLAPVGPGRAPDHVGAQRLHVRPDVPLAGQSGRRRSPDRARSTTPPVAARPSSPPARAPQPSQGSGRAPSDTPSEDPSAGAPGGSASARSDDSDVKLRVRVDGVPPSGSAKATVRARTGLLGGHPVRRRIVVGSSG